MDGLIFGFFALSAVLFFGMLHYLSASRRPGMYPPKKILKKRAMVLGSSGGAALLLAILFLTVM
jgi:hypothetical protein